MRRLIFIILLCFSVCSLADPPVIAVASNLTAPMTEIVRQYEADTGTTFRLMFGSSGNIARQIVQGAPYELFISASGEYIDFLLREGVINTNGWEFAEGPIGLFVPKESTLYPDTDLKSVITSLKYSSFKKIVLANPEHAPYGAAALQALQSAGIWALEQNRMILAEDVAQIIPFALSGNIDLAIIPYSFMKLDKLKDSGLYIEFPKDWYSPVVQYVVLLENATETTREFEQFLGSDRVRKILEQYGYATPELH